MQAKFKGTQHSILNKILSENHFLNVVIVLIPAVSRRQYHSYILAVPGSAHAPFTSKFLKGVCLHGPSEYTCQI